VTGPGGQEVHRRSGVGVPARKEAASKIIGRLGHKQAYMMATLVQELRNEEQFMADFAHGVV
jgi:hypothetical protein